MIVHADMRKMGKHRHLHSHDDACLSKASFLDSGVKPRDESWEETLAFSECQATGGKGNTGRAAEAKASVIDVVQLVLGEHLFHLG